MILLFLVINSIRDIQKREIYLCPTIIMIIVGAINRILRKINLYEYFIEVLIGIIIIAFGLIIKNSVGAGDGLVILALSGFMEIIELFTCLLYAFLILIIFSLILKATNINKKELPLCPFILLGYLGGLI